MWPFEFMKSGRCIVYFLFFCFRCGSTQTCILGWVLREHPSVYVQGRTFLFWWSRAHRSVHPPEKKIKKEATLLMALISMTDYRSAIIETVHLPGCLQCCQWCWSCTAFFSDPATSFWCKCMASSQNRANENSFCGLKQEPRCIDPAKVPFPDATLDGQRIDTKLTFWTFPSQKHPKLIDFIWILCGRGHEETYYFEV